MRKMKRLMVALVLHAGSTEHWEQWLPYLSPAESCGCSLRQPIRRWAKRGNAGYFHRRLLAILSIRYSFHMTSYKNVPREELASVPHLASLRP
jgi:hypothetical protein